MKQTVIFEGGIQGLRTLADGSLRIQVDTQELPAETLTRIFQLKSHHGLVMISTDEITQAEQEAVSDATSDSFQQKRKTPSQRLRAVLFKLWKQEGESRGYDFDTWYKNKMEQLIDHYKDKLTD